MQNLNENQLSAINHIDGPCMVIAGPGSGKTTVIVNRVIYLINKNINPENILVMTFSKAAANEMKERFNIITNNKYKKVLFGTFHSVFFQILSQYGGFKLENLIDENEKHKVFTNICKDKSIRISKDEDTIKDVINEISLVKNDLNDLNHYKPNICSISTLVKISEYYEQYKDKYNKFDYDDMLLECFRLLNTKTNVLKSIQEKYKYIMVDEFQDINTVQFETLSLMYNEHNNIFIVGDDDQSIYGFRGANPKFFIEFSNRLSVCKKIYLCKNYRNPKYIVKLSDNLIKNNNNRLDKKMEVMNTCNNVFIIECVEDFQKEAEFVGKKIIEKVSLGCKFSDIAIIFRTRNQAAIISNQLLESRIPFSISDDIVSIYKHWISKDIESYLKIAVERHTNEDIIRIINKPNRFISRDTISKVIEKVNILDELLVYNSLNNLQIGALRELKMNIRRIKSFDAFSAIRYIRDYIGYDDYLRKYSLDRNTDFNVLKETVDTISINAKREQSILDFLLCIEKYNKSTNEKHSKTQNCVRLMTMHKSKGLEFENVFITGCIEGLIPHYKNNISNDELEEERRLFYVAMTRTKKQLYITIPQNRSDKKTKISRFIDETLLNTLLNMKLIHNIFGMGIIVQVKNNDFRIIVQFEKDTKVLDLYICLKNNIIKFL